MDYSPQIFSTKQSTSKVAWCLYGNQTQKYVNHDHTHREYMSFYRAHMMDEGASLGLRRITSSMPLGVGEIQSS